MNCCEFILLNSYAKIIRILLKICYSFEKISSLKLTLVIIKLKSRKPLKAPALSFYRMGKPEDRKYAL